MKDIGYGRVLPCQNRLAFQWPLPPPEAFRPRYHYEEEVAKVVATSPQHPKRRNPGYLDRVSLVARYDRCPHDVGVRHSLRTYLRNSTTQIPRRPQRRRKCHVDFAGSGGSVSKKFPRRLNRSSHPQ